MIKHLLIISAIFIVAGFFRYYGLNWDQNNHLNPDERFLTMVGLAMKWPSSLPAYLDTSHSQLNPHNIGQPFYVYGTLPVILVKFVAETFHLADYDQFVLVGRAISTAADLGTLILVYLIARRLLSDPSPALLAALIYALSVLPIQLSHFFTVDTFLVFFITAAFYFLTLFLSPLKFGKLVVVSAGMGLFFGLALSAKITAGLFIPIIGLGFVVKLLKSKNLLRVVILGSCFTLFAYFSLRLAQPYLFADSRLLSFSLNPQLLANWRQLKSYDDPSGFFPPAIQWITTPALVYPFLNLLYWGLGLPLGLLVIVSLFTVSVSAIKNRRWDIFLIIVWSVSLFLYQGFQFSKPLRYFYPIYPFLAVSAAILIHQLAHRVSRLSFILLILILFIWPLAFVSIYSQPHPRVAATTWIYSHIPFGSTLSCDYWDDCLPLGGSGPYTTLEYHLYDAESPSKWATLIDELNRTDYLILSSNRLYGSITTVPQKYPDTNRFYQALFSGRLGFSRVAEFSSRPRLPIPGISLCLTPPFLTYGQISQISRICSLSGLSFVDDYSDETLTVYDHPQVIIFHKTTSVDYASVLSAPKI